MKYWVESILPIMGAVFLLSWTGHSAQLRVLEVDVPFSVTYEYRIDLNISEAIPSIEAAVDQLRNATLTELENLVHDKDNPPFRIVDFETIVIGMIESLCIDPCRYSLHTHPFVCLYLQALAKARATCARMFRAPLC